MNAIPIKQIIGTGARSGHHHEEGARACLLDIFKGVVPNLHPYPPKCEDPYMPRNNGRNRELARIALLFDEDDLNYTPSQGAGGRLNWNATGPERLRLGAGLHRDAVGVAADDDDDDDSSDSGEPEPPPAANIIADEVRSTVTGLRSAVYAVIAFTATPSACGADGQQGVAASKTTFCVLKMKPPLNYVGYAFTAPPYAQRTISFMPVPDRKDTLNIAKTALYKQLFIERGLWNGGPPDPFTMDARGTIKCPKRARDDDPDANQIWELVDAASRQRIPRRQAVLRDDGEGIRRMLASTIEQLDGSVEPERRCLIMSNYTKETPQKQRLARLLLDDPETSPGLFEDDERFFDECLIANLFVIIFDFKHVELVWRGAPSIGSSNAAADHETLTLQNALADPSLGEAQAWYAEVSEPKVTHFEDSRRLLSIRSNRANINMLYKGLLNYARRMRARDPTFKLRSVALVGQIGGRGLNYKPHKSHAGFLTDMLFMFDALRTRQISTHGEYVLQAIGRLCGLVVQEYLDAMGLLPPRLWTSQSCYNVAATFARAIEQWVNVIQHKPVDWTMAAAITHAIRTNPQANVDLNKLYRRPTGHARNGTAQHLTPSRLKGAEKRMREVISTGASMAPAPPDHGLAPAASEAESAAEQLERGRRAMERDRQMADEDDGGEPETQRPRPRQQRPRVMKAKFQGIYAAHPDLATTTGDSPLAMPSYQQTIYVKWSDWHHFPHYPATVVDIHVESRAANDVHITYHVRFDTDDHFNELPESEKMYQWLELDPDMAEWQYDNPNAPGT